MSKYITVAARGGGVRRGGGGGAMAPGAGKLGAPSEREKKLKNDHAKL